MPSTTPNRGYPFPLDEDRIDPAVNIEALARAVDTDAESLSDAIDVLTASDATMTADYIARDLAITVDGFIALGPGRHQTNGLSLQGSWSAVTLDGFAHAEMVFPTPFVYDPVVIVSGANASNPQVSTTGLFTDIPTTNTGFHVVAHGWDGGDLAGTILVFYWLAFGFISD